MLQIGLIGKVIPNDSTTGNGKISFLQKVAAASAISFTSYKSKLLTYNTSSSDIIQLNFYSNLNRIQNYAVLFQEDHDRLKQNYNELRHLINIQSQELDILRHQVQTRTSKVRECNC